MKRLILPALLTVVSCSVIQETSDKLEASHYSLYGQKVLVVYALRANRVIFSNPANTRYYFLKGKQYKDRWAMGDTFVIENNLNEFYLLKYLKKP